MKKITLIIVAAMSTSSLFAQTGNSYLMLNYGINQNIKNFSHPSYSPPFNLQKGGTPFGIQWIKGTKNNSAFRFGFEIYKKPILIAGKWNSLNDTSTYSFSTSNLIIPRFTFGKEFRKQIHKDVMLYAGSDFGIGVMSNLFVNNTQTYAGNEYIGQSGGGRPKLDLSLSARPFMGIRTDWNRFTIGYEASLPINYIQVIGESYKSVDDLKLNHQISIGYKLFNKK